VGLRDFLENDCIRKTLRMFYRVQSISYSVICVSSTWDFFSIEASSRLRCAIDPSKYGSMTVIEVLIEPIEPMSLEFESPSRDPSDWTTE